MRNSKINFPHPLLNEYTNDYVDGCRFELNEIAVEDISENGAIFSIPVTYSLTCDGIAKLVEEEKAAVVVRVVCGATSYREIISFPSKNSMRINISKNEVSKKIDFTSYIIAKREITDFHVEEHNPDYFEGVSFHLNAGEIIAMSETISMNIDDSELEKHVSSIVKIDRVDTIEKMEVKYDTDDGLIHILFPAEQYIAYEDLINQYSKYGILRFLQSSVMIPAIAEAVMLLREEKSITDLDDTAEIVYGDTVWAESLFRRCEELDCDLYDKTISAFGLADDMLASVTADAIKDLYNFAKELYNSKDDTRLGGVD